MPDLLHGKGIWLRRIARDSARASGGLSTLAAEVQTAGFSHAVLPAADGADPANTEAPAGPDRAADLTRLLRAAGLHVWGWHALYGDTPSFKGPLQDGYHRAEAACALRRAAQLREAGLQGYVLVAEAGYERIPDRADKAAEFMEILRAGLPDLPIALSARKNPSDHPGLPWAEFRRQCDADLPPVFWPGRQGAAAQMLEASWREFAELDPRLPYAPVGPAFTYQDWEPAPQDVEAFLTRALSLGLPGVSFWSWDGAPPARAEGRYWQAIEAFEWTAPPEAETHPLGPAAEAPAAFGLRPEQAEAPDEEALLAATAFDPEAGTGDRAGLRLESGDAPAIEQEEDAGLQAWLPDSGDDLPAWLRAFPLEEPEAEMDAALDSLADRLFSPASLAESGPALSAWEAGPDRAAGMSDPVETEWGAGSWAGAAPGPAAESEEAAAADEEAEALLARLKAEADQLDDGAEAVIPMGLGPALGDDDTSVEEALLEADWVDDAGPALGLDADGDWIDERDETEEAESAAGFGPGEDSLPEWLEDWALEPAFPQAVRWASTNASALADAPASPAGAARTLGQFFKALRQGRADDALELYAAGCVHVTGERVTDERDRVLRFYDEWLKRLAPGTLAVLGLRGSRSAVSVTWTARSSEAEMIRVEDTFHLNRAGRIVYHQTSLAAAGAQPEQA